MVLIEEVALVESDMTVEMEDSATVGAAIAQVETGGGVLMLMGVTWKVEAVDMEDTVLGFCTSVVVCTALSAVLMQGDRVTGTTWSCR